MAEWMLCLGVEINDSSGYTLYRSQSLSSGEIAHVIINVDAQCMESSSGLTHKTLYIPSGKHILRTTFEIVSATAVKRSVPWTDVLGAAFGQKIIASLLAALNSTNGLLLEHLLEVINNPGYMRTRPSYLPPRDIGWRRENAEWVMWRLPELQPCFEHSVGQLLSSPLRQTTIEELENSWYSIVCACNCPRCSPQPGVENKVCLEILTMTIFEYLIILRSVSINPTILPSCSGIRFLYNITALRTGSHRHLGKFTFRNTFDFDQHIHLEKIFEVLTGQKFETAYPDRRKSAIAANGICIFIGIMSDLDVSPLGMDNIKVIPGHIEFEDSPCVETLDVPWPEDDQWRHSRRQLVLNNTSYNMVVHQKWHDASIQIGYQMKVRGTEGPATGLYETRLNVLQKRTLCDCTVWCQAKRQDCHLPGQQASGKDEWLAVALTRLANETDDTLYGYTLETFRCSYPQLYLGVLMNRPNSRVSLIRIKNCSRCMLMYAAETLFDAPGRSNVPSGDLEPRGTITIRRWGAPEIQIELTGQEFKNGRRELSGPWKFGHPCRKPNEVEAVPLFPNVPLDHDPVD